MKVKHGGITPEDAELARQAEAEQRARYEGDPWEAAVLRYCETMADKPVFTEDVLLTQIGKKLSDITKQDRNRISRILQSAGYRRSNSVRAGGRVRSGFYPPVSFLEAA